MPNPYSSDLRQRVLAACDAGALKRSEIAQQFQVSEAALYNWLRRRRESGTFAAKAHAGGHVPHVDPAVLRDIVEANNDRTLPEYVWLYAERTGHRYSTSWLSRMCIRLKLSRKKRRSAPASSSSPRLQPNA